MFLFTPVVRLVIFLIYTIKVTIWSSITCWFENWKYVASPILLIYCIFNPNLLQNWKIYYINKNTILWETWCDRARKSSTCAKQWNSTSLKKILQMSIKLKGTFSHHLGAKSMADAFTGLMPESWHLNINQESKDFNVIFR